MFIIKRNAVIKAHSATCTIKEYNFKRKNLDLAVATINGRYPEGHTKVVNTTCDMIYYVISGNGMVHHETGDFLIHVGDSVFLKKNKWYWVEGENLKVVIASTPAWFVGQYKEID
jgi:mannose-6-phosphate isomerase-like protein (cupin superfamily)